MTFATLASTAVLFALSPESLTKHLAATQSKVTTLAASSSVFPMEVINTPEKNYNQLLTWLKSTENGVVNSKIEIKPSDRGGGFGAFVNAPVEADEVLFTVPREACVTLTDAINDANCGEAFGNLIKAAGPGGNTVVMAGYLAKEYLLSKESTTRSMASSNNSEDNQFGPYLATLPWERGINNQEHVLFWDEQDVENLLRGSLCYRESMELRAEVDLAIKILNGIIGPSVLAARKNNDEEGSFKWPWQSGVPKVNGIVDGLPEAVKGAFVCILTRSFQDGEGDNEKLVPLLDMLQHEAEPNVRHAMRKSDGIVEVRARQPIKEGEELLNQYRAEEEDTMPYHRFFSRFGFVPGIMEPIENLLEDRSSIFYPLTAEV